MEERIKSYRELIIWQKLMDLVVLVYQITEDFSKVEIYDMTLQMRRCAVSIPSNIAESKIERNSKRF